MLLLQYSLAQFEQHSKNKTLKMAWPTTAKRLCPWKNWIQLIVFFRILAIKCMITSYVIGFFKIPLQAKFSHWLSILFFSAKEIKASPLHDINEKYIMNLKQLVLGGIHFQSLSLDKLR